MLNNIVLKIICNFAFEFFMVLDFKVNRRLVVEMTINFFCTYSNEKIKQRAIPTVR